MPKTHARDYLLEYASQPSTAGWMRDLIIRLVTANGQLIDEDLAQSKEQLKSNGPSALPMPTVTVTDSPSEIKLTKLVHHSGVNALADEQQITFSNDVTLLYGQNGTGKSSYFRVLNEVVGGSRVIRIHRNIYAESTAPVNVDIYYTEDGVEKSLHWDGTTRSIAPLNQASVFDSIYTDDLLEKRSADTALVHPLGLHLFTALTRAMDNIKERLGGEIEAIKRLLPQIRLDNLGDIVRNVINQQTFRQEQQTYITSRYEMSDERVAELEDCKRQYKELTATNYDDKIKIATNEKALVDGLKNHLKNCYTQLQQLERAATELYGELKAARAALDVTKQKIGILAEIGNTSSSEWRAFIQSGATYQKGSALPAGTCPYCRQPLQGDAIKIVQAYADFLNDQTAGAYNGLVKQKNQLQVQVGRLTTKYNLSEQLLKIIEAQPNGQEIKEYVVRCLTQFEDTKNRLLASFEKEQYENEVQDSGFRIHEVQGGEGSLDVIVAKYDEALTQLNVAKTGKDEKLGVLKTKMTGLLEHQAIAAQKELFADWFQKMQMVKEYIDCQSELSTRYISSLSKEASRHLLTDSLREKFQEELDALKLGDLKVSLGEEGASRGQSYMKIKLDTEINTREILSEGEQKGVALALFIAERRMQATKNPIILDDPVNSLDHHITAHLMERLVDLGNQIIIFSHHLLLKKDLLALNTIHECGPGQVGSCKAVTKHLFMYSVYAYHERMGHVVDSKKENAKSFIEAARRTLSKQDFCDEDILVCGSQLRKAIEMMVDEVVFCGLTPLEYRGSKKTAIQWEKLKALNPQPDLVETLHGFYSLLSDGNLHLSMESCEHPVSWKDPDTICRTLRAFV